MLQPTSFLLALSLLASAPADEDTPSEQQQAVYLLP